MLDLVGEGLWVRGKVFGDNETTLPRIGNLGGTSRPQSSAIAEHFIPKILFVRRSIDIRQLGGQINEHIVLQL